MFIYNLDDLGKGLVDEFEEYLKSDMWLEGIPGGFVTNSPKRQVNTYGDGKGDLIKIRITNNFSEIKKDNFKKYF